MSMPERNIAAPSVRTARANITANLAEFASDTHTASLRQIAAQSQDVGLSAIPVRAGQPLAKWDAYQDRAPTPDEQAAPNPWLAVAAQYDDEALAAWLADLRIIEHDAAGDDPTSTNTREIAALMRQAVERELALRRRAGASKPAPTGGLPREQARRLREEIRRRVDLVALIADDVPGLRRSGSSWRGRCPLHDDHDPSLVVWPERGRWRCFGCGIGGDAVTWLMATRPQLDYRAALAYAAQRAGLPAAATVTWPSCRRKGGRP